MAAAIAAVPATATGVTINAKFTESDALRSSVGRTCKRNHRAHTGASYMLDGKHCLVMSGGSSL